MTKAQFRKGYLALLANGKEFIIERIDGGFRAIGGKDMMIFNADAKLSFVIEKLTEATK